jgi:hypothetical protein
MPHKRKGQKARKERQMSASLRRIARSGLQGQEQIAMLKRRPGNSTKEIVRLEKNG